MTTTRGVERPVVTVGPALVLVLVLVTVIVVGTSWLAPLVPVDRGTGWVLVQKSLGVNAARSVPSWWMVVLFAVAALGCHAQAVAVWARGGWTRVLAAAWWTVGLGMVWISLDHALAFHEVAPSLASGVLPGVLAERPVEVALGALLAPAGLVLVGLGTWAQRLLIVLSAAAYGGGQVVLPAGLIDLGLTAHRTSVVEAAFQLTGALLLLAACGVTPARVRDRQDGHVVSVDAPEPDVAAR